MNYYNEWDKHAAAWLRELIARGLIPPGDVDQRSITEVGPKDLDGYTQCHFFAGIGGWPLALAIAGVDHRRRLWSGSCPCQPFSTAGKKMGRLDPRHLWPAWRRLIARCGPPEVYGEQVASAAGREWLARVRLELATLGYAARAADLCSAGAGEIAEGWIVRGDQAAWEPIVNGAPNIRQRLFWMADADEDRRYPGSGDERGAAGARGEDRDDVERRGSTGWLADAECAERRPIADRHELNRHNGGWDEAAGGFAGLGQNGDRRLGDTGTSGLPHAEPETLQGARWWEEGRAVVESGGAFGFWSAFDILPCTDGKARRAEPGSFPLAHGISGRVGRLRGYGNAINPWVAAAFIRAAQSPRRRVLTPVMEVDF